MKVEVNINKWFVILVLGVIIVIVGVFAVNAYYSTFAVTCGAANNWCGAGDVNRDGRLDADDYFIMDVSFSTHSGQTCGSANDYCDYSDLNGDGQLNAADYVVMDSSYLSFGVKANPSLMGHSVDEVDGLKEFILSVKSQSSGLVCDSAALVDTMPGNNVRLISPSNRQLILSGSAAVCLSAEGCYLRQEVYDISGIKSTRDFFFKENGAHVWSSVFEGFGFSGVDGDLTRSQVIPAFDNQIKIQDDGTDFKAFNEIVIRDVSSSYGQKIFLCHFDYSPE